jgi:hypothetical protein
MLLSFALVLILADDIFQLSIFLQFSVTNFRQDKQILNISKVFARHMI